MKAMIARYNVIFFALAVATLIYIAMGYFIKDAFTARPLNSTLVMVLQGIALATVLGSFVWGFLFSPQKILQIIKTRTTTLPLGGFTISPEEYGKLTPLEQENLHFPYLFFMFTIVRFALLEACAILGVMLTIFTGEVNHVLYLGICAFLLQLSLIKAFNDAVSNVAFRIR